MFFIVIFRFFGGGRRLSGAGWLRLCTRGLVHCRDARSISASSVLHVRRTGAAADEPTDVFVTGTR